jgi:hypothetical protein
MLANRTATILSNLILQFISANRHELPLEVITTVLRFQNRIPAEILSSLSLTGRGASPSVSPCSDSMKAVPGLNRIDRPFPIISELL